MSASQTTAMHDVGAGLSPRMKEVIQAGCQLMAPCWPLDQLIAVNPLWEHRQQGVQFTSARLSALQGFQSLMPAPWYRELWQNPIQATHLHRAARELGVPANTSQLLLELDRPLQDSHFMMVSDWLDSQRNIQHEMPWKEEITHQISQFCARFFQDLGNEYQALRPEQGLYKQWLDNTHHDHGIAILMRDKGLVERFRALPDNAEALLVEAFEGMAIEFEQAENVTLSLLLSINGWSSWVAYLRWQASLENRHFDLMSDLLAIRIAWEWVLWQQASKNQHQATALQAFWSQQLADLPAAIGQRNNQQKPLWVWQRALELCYQTDIERKLSAPPPEPISSPQVLQAVFCIDVRSEVFRRALEILNPGIETRGFAGFFGLPIAYTPAGTDLRQPQLPGLLAPQLGAREAACGDTGARSSKLNLKARWDDAWNSPAANFSLVEGIGLWHGFKLLRDSLLPSRHRHPLKALTGAGKLELHNNGQALDAASKASLAAGILRHMGLTQDLANTVLLVGHGSESRNNPHAAGLDCGACGGQSGEVNVRILADLLNDSEVRVCLGREGIALPASTRFVAALHNTTTDDVEVFGELSSTVSNWLKAASHRARCERSTGLGIEEKRPELLARLLQQRSRDWSQTRPEWGLANNAAFIVAPRQRTRHLNLEGRVFLHDYDWHNDTDFQTLELILSAPMVVTNWINMQYNLSTSDNHHWGSGNKVLHNVVGGHIGVFEGNGGDLRIGLPKQSLHDGKQWRHRPQRLSVYVAAPREAIAGVMQKHETVANLVNNEWLYLFCLDEPGKPIQRIIPNPL